MEILSAHIEENIFVPGLGEIPKELNTSGLKYDRLSMAFNEETGIVAIKISKGNSKYNLLIPVSRFKYLRIANVE